MASKYVGLKGKVPTQPTERDEEVKSKLAEWKDYDLAALTNLYNANRIGAGELAKKVKENSAHADAMETLIQEKLDAMDGDAVTMNGYTWSPKFEPYPVCEDPEQIVKYFKEHGMEDQLTLSKTELASRLKTFVKEEALANELIIEQRTTVVDGVEVTVNDVRSKIPGVRVFLKDGLSRAKAKGAK